jgi:NADPH:quinone reductase-like Zn-dependent oxidoreductase
VAGRRQVGLFAVVIAFPGRVRGARGPHRRSEVDERDSALAEPAGDVALGGAGAVLLEGTGGVSVFGLQLAAAAGAKPIITSSSDAKLARARELGAFGTVNYRSNPEWQRTVRELTGGAGVDQVLEVGGQDTLPRAIEALGFGGHIAIIGGLSGFASDVPVGALMGLNATASGIYVGSRADFEALNGFLSQHKIKPIVDKVFELEDAPAAFEAMDSGDFFGKVVIRL